QVSPPVPARLPTATIEARGLPKAVEPRTESSPRCRQPKRSFQDRRTSIDRRAPGRLFAAPHRLLLSWLTHAIPWLSSFRVVAGTPTPPTITAAINGSTRKHRGWQRPYFRSAANFSR